VPPEVEGSALAGPFTAFVDMSFQTYQKLFEPMAEFFRRLYPKDPNDSDFVYRSTITAKTCDTLRDMLPAATRSNVGIYGTGQAYEQLLLRLRAHPLREMREYADLMLVELRKVIPAFLKRVDLPDRGMAWSEYLADTSERTREIASKVLAGMEPEPRDAVTLVDWDPEGEVKVVAAALYAVSDLPDDQLLEIAHAMSPAEREAAFAAYVGERGNRRHKPGRAFERTQYRFDVLCDYGAFRDLQRHRLLTLEWQRLTTKHGYELPPEIEEAGFVGEWRSVMDRSREVHEALLAEGLDEAAQYTVAMAYGIRFVMQMNAREAMHVIELRSTPQGHPVYRRIVQEMHRLIDDKAGHHAIAGAMGYVDHSNVELERLEAERRTEARRRVRG
jgi:thymidylate synthase ThyX